MTRKDLILKIISLYPDTFREDRPEHVQAWVEIYEKAIPSTWDMDKLMYRFATTYKSTVVPPHPSFFFEFRNDVRPQPKPEPIERVENTPEQEEAIKKRMQEFRQTINGLALSKDINNTLREGDSRPDNKC